MQKNNWVIIGDIIGSRKVADRKGTQQRLNYVLDEINNRYHDQLLLPFKITLGDEFVGQVNTCSIILDLLQYLNIQLSGIKLRFGIGYGLMESGYKGTGYRNALQAVETAKKNKYIVHLIADELDNIDEEPGNIDEPINTNELEDAKEKADKFPVLLNTILHLYFMILSGYNDRQKYIIYQMIEGKTQWEIAHKLGINSQSSISQSLSRINWRLLMEIHDIFPQLTNFSFAREHNYLKNQGEYIALIGAWPLETRNELVTEKLLEFVNQSYGEIIKADFTVTALSPEDKDYYEFQVLLYNLADYREDFLRLVSELFVLIDKLQLGIGIGEISTDFRQQAIGMDGDSFYRAREAINSCFKTKTNLSFISGQQDLDRLYTLILSLFLEYLNGWSFKQYTVLRFKEGGLIQNEIRKNMKLNSRSTVAEHLQRVGWQEYSYLLGNLNTLLK